MNRWGETVDEFLTRRTNKLADCIQEEFEKAAVADDSMGLMPLPIAVAIIMRRAVERFKEETDD